MSINPYFDIIIISADAQAIMQWVLMPASFERFVRSSPTIMPQNDASITLNMYSDVGYFAKN